LATTDNFIFKFIEMLRRYFAAVSNGTQWKNYLTLQSATSTISS